MAPGLKKAASGPPVRSVDIPWAIVAQATADQNRIISILFEELHPLPRTDDDRKKFYEKLNRLTSPFWPVIAPHRILPETIVAHLVQIRSEWCFNDQMNLCSLWGADIYQKLSKLAHLPTRTVQKEEIEELKKNFSAVYLLFSVIQLQESVRVVARQPLESSLYAIDRLHHNFPKLREVTRKLTQIIQREQQARSHFLAGMSRTKIASVNRPSLMEAQCSAIITSLDLGMLLWKDPYYCQFMLRMPLGQLSIPANSPKDLSINVEQINCYIEMLRVGWVAVNERKWIAAVPDYMVALKGVPSFKMKDDSASKAFTQYIRTALATLESHHLPTAEAYFEAAAGKLSWEEYARRTKMSTDKEFTKMVTIEQWLAETFACLSLADQQLMQIHQLYENCICKPSNPKYFTFDELCSRLFQNFRKVFSEKKPLTPSPSAKPIEQILSQFSDDLLVLRHAFEKQIDGYLPEKEVHQTVLKIIALFKDSCNYLPILASLFEPYRKAVIFAANKVPPALEKARHRLFKRLHRSASQLSLPAQLEERQYLIERIESLCFSRMQPLVELFMTLRDIHAVLLAPQEATEELEKGLHLIPQEITRLVHPTEIAQMIESLFQEKQKSPSLEEVVQLVDSSDFEGARSSEEAPLPPLENNSDPISLKIVQAVKEAGHFKIAKGEKARKILERLRQLGVYTLRHGKGNHFIVAHPNTATTFSMPDHETLSPGVAKELELWVRQIFSLPDHLLDS